MTSQMKRLVLLAAVPILSTAAGCAGRYTGGGSIDSLAGPPARATFGFAMHAEDEDGDAEADAFRGQFQYRDHGVGVGLHAEIEELTNFEGIILGSFCLNGFCDSFGEEGLAGNASRFRGTYTPQPRRLGEGGEVEGILVDTGRLGVADPSDYMAVTLVGGVYDGYGNGGFLRGGNITYHPDDE